MASASSTAAYSRDALEQLSGQVVDLKPVRIFSSNDQRKEFLVGFIPSVSSAISLNWTAFIDTACKHRIAN